MQTIFILMNLLFFISCNNSSFSGTNKTKHIPPDDKTDEVIVNTTNEESKEKEIEVSDEPMEQCFKKPAPLPGELTEPTLLYNWHPEGDKTGYNQSISSVVVGSLGRSKPSILVIGHTGTSYGSGYLFAIDGETGESLWTSEMIVDNITPAIGDIDKDGKNEIVVLSGARATILNGNEGTIKWQGSDPISIDVWSMDGISLADTDSDGEAEIVVNSKVLDSKGNLKFALADVFLETLTADVNLDGNQEIINPKGVYSGRDGKNICIFGKPIYHIGMAKLRESDKQMTIVGKENCPEYCFNENPLKAYNGRTCEEVFSVEFDAGGGGPINMADFDGDNELEIGIAGNRFYVAVDTDGTVLWRTENHDNSSGVTGSTTFDFNGDGKSEIVYADEQNLMVLDGTTGNIIYKTPRSSGTVTEYPIVADVDGDGHANIVIGANNAWWGSLSGLLVYQAPQNDWIGTRTIWNQYNYSITNVSDKGDIVGFESKSIWSKWVKKPHLLGFRNNLIKRPLTDPSECE